MANNNMYHHNANTSFSWTEPDHEPDDISVFVRQILRPSSSSSSNFMNMKGNEMQCSSSLQHVVQKNQHGLESCSMLNTSSGNILSSFSGAYNIPTGVVNVCSSSVGTMGNDLDEYECESEGGTEDFVVEASGQQPSSSSSRNSSKRSRAAEVHNLSEKRRRSRINEKMKALQNLIPNSNKTDKASMLDEAIEYLKQLQLQVQMLTMKNGLFPLGLPRVLQQNQLSQQRMGLCEGDGFMKDNVASALHVNQDTSLKAIFSPSNNCTETKLTPVATMANVNLHNAFESESSINTHLDPFQLSRTSKGMWKEDWLPLHELNERPSTLSIGAHIASLAPFDTNASNLKSNTLEACLHRYQLGALNETNMDCDQLLAPHLYSHVGRSTSVDIIKNECSNF